MEKKNRIDLQTRIDDIDFGHAVNTRIHVALDRFHTIEELVRCDLDNGKGIWMIGDIDMKNLRDFLAPYGLRLCMSEVEISEYKDAFEEQIKQQKLTASTRDRYWHQVENQLVSKMTGIFTEVGQEFLDAGSIRLEVQMAASRYISRLRAQQELNDHDPS